MSHVNQPPVNEATVMCRNVSYQRHNKMLLQELDCTFSGGRISVILGKNGAGKSTLLSLLTKELEPTKGSIQLDQRQLADYPFSCLAKLRSVLPQMQNLPFAISVEQLIELGAEVQELPYKTQRIVAAVMRVCDVEHLQGRDVTSLSGGEQKRVQLARVLAQIWPIEKLEAGDGQAFAHRWLFLDEWTNGLDLHHQQQLVKDLRSWTKQGLGVVMVLHDLNLTAQVADHIKILRDGKLAEEGATLEVLQADAIQRTLDLQVNIVQQSDVDYPLVILN